jgi:hypothetical protein
MSFHIWIVLPLPLKKKEVSLDDTVCLHEGALYTAALVTPAPPCAALEKADIDCYDLLGLRELSFRWGEELNVMVDFMTNDQMQMQITL